jgi:hypothetical protein
MRVNQFKLKNKFYSKITSKSAERSKKNQMDATDEKIRNYHMSHYLYDSSIVQIKKSKNFDYGKDLDNLPFVIGDSVNAICEANEILQNILDSEELEQKDLIHALGKHFTCTVYKLCDNRTKKENQSEIQTQLIQTEFKQTFKFSNFST